MRLLGFMALLCLGSSVPKNSSQETPMRYPGQASATPALTSVGPGVWRLEGKDSGSGIAYVRVLLLAVSSPQPAAVQDETHAQPADLDQPTLTGQCTRDGGGKLHFELFANFGGVPDAAFYPPWRSSGPDDLYPSPKPKVQLTMEFLGYTRVKPFRRQFEQVDAPGPEQMRYLNPGKSSSNLEAPGWFFQYLRSLPTLRLTGANHSAQWFTTPWLDQLHREPLCAVSGA